MFTEHIPSPDRDADRGQVGIGTLIVFIAMVLVAAIAAGVLINTAGFLQQQGQETGEQSSQQVSNSIQVKNELGVADGGGNVDQVRLTVSKSPGADDIDLSELTITASGPNGEVVMSYNSNDNNSGVDATTTGLYELGAAIGSGPGYSTSSKALTNSSDMAVILVPFTSGIGGAQAPIAAGETVTLRIATADGAETTVQVAVPTPLSQATDGEYIEGV